MFGDTARQLIGMLGASGAIPGAIGADDVPAAITRLRQGLQAQVAPAAQSDAPSPTEGEEQSEPPVALATRAVPLLELLERAGAARVPVMWDVA